MFQWGRQRLQLCWARRAPCVKSLGLQTQEQVSGIGRHVPVDEVGQSAVSGLRLAGNAANPMAQVIMAATDGLGVGVNVNADLMHEEFAHKMAKLSREISGGPADPGQTPIQAAPSARVDTPAPWNPRLATRGS